MTVKTQTQTQTQSGSLARIFNSRKNYLKVPWWQYLLALFLSVLFLFPLYWMGSTSLKTMEQAYAFPPVWIPNPIMWENYVRIFTELPFALFTLNSLIITVLNTIGVTFSAAFVAFGFARLRAKGRDVLFIILISTIMLPYQVILVPTFLLFKYLGWINTFGPLIVPAFFGGGAFNIFLLRQFFMGIPFEYDEAAIMDGAGWFRIFWSIILPMAKPALTAVAVLNIVYVWTDFFGPLIYLNDLNKMTLAVGLAFLRGQHSAVLTLLMAGSMLSTIPMLIVFFLAQRYFVSGIQLGGIKG
ncbi:MAG: carbohydrate ABC transporter permease [Chloroflexi bacterium]|nr:MAG: carbohydrate ABC transporter permease [Chloroflexota bacterium]